MLVVCILSFAAQASQRAVTDEGDIVILNDDGTWVYESPDSVELPKILVNDREFRKPQSSTFRLKSTINDSEIWLNAKKWSFQKDGGNEDSEYTFQLKGQDLYGMLITEQIELGIEHLADVALQNAQSAAPDMRIVMQEYRNVNGTAVLYMEMQGSMQGAEFTFRGNYFANDSGSTQFLVYTGTNLVGKYENDIQEMLNGFSIQ